VNSPFTKAAFDEGVQDLFKGNVTCDVNEHGPPTRGPLADALDLVPKTVPFHLTGLAALGVVIPDPAPDRPAGDSAPTMGAMRTGSTSCTPRSAATSERAAERTQ
jgi:hypothetical protein